MKKWLFLIIPLLLYIFFMPQKLKKEKKYITVSEGVITKSVQYKGLLEPSVMSWYYAHMNFEINWRAENGISVKEGDVVLKYDSASFEENIESHEEGIVDKKNVLKEMQMQQTFEMKRAQLETVEDQLRFEQDKFLYEEELDIPNIYQKKAYQFQLQKEELRRDFAKSKFEVDNALYEKGLVSQKTLQTSRINLVRAESNYLKAYINFQENMKGARPLLLERRKLQMEMSEATYLASKEREDRLAKIHEYDQINIKEDILSIQKKIDRFKQRKDSCEVKAPFAGTVYFPPTYKGSVDGEPIEIGETPVRGVGLLYFTNSDQYDIIFYINESEMNHINVEDPIKVKLISDESVVLNGNIKEFSEILIDKNIALGGLALARTGESGIQVIKVTAKLNDTHSVLRQGITGVITLPKKYTEKLVVPIESIVVKDQKTHVKLKTGKLTEVVLGENDGFQVQVLNGLSRGDVIEYE